MFATNQYASCSRSTLRVPSVVNFQHFGGYMFRRPLYGAGFQHCQDVQSTNRSIAEGSLFPVAKNAEWCGHRRLPRQQVPTWLVPLEGHNPEKGIIQTNIPKVSQFVRVFRFRLAHSYPAQFFDYRLSVLVPGSSCDAKFTPFGRLDPSEVSAYFWPRLCMVVVEAIARELTHLFSFR